jgi:hypothetical protein
VLRCTLNFIFAGASHDYCPISDAGLGTAESLPDF